ncbi:MAG: hypothetical protein M1389_00005, partial [Chloroflexi bacterium]|nr:hypothetical protein [Chloroflexota bacterium]
LLSKVPPLPRGYPLFAASSIRATAGDSRPPIGEYLDWPRGQEITGLGFVWGMIRHRTYHLGELVYLRRALGLDEPRYYHEKQ